ncbi:MAG TPA: hypothetical protein PK858_07330, partial [Saprospiraceae bacterium]|nr:hypothetical protein [Saprospiraceae bacterium]
MTRILLAYSPANADLAATLSTDLGRIGLPFDHITCLPQDAPGDFAARLRQHEEPVLLIVTDNLLRSTQCMGGLLEAVQHLHLHRLLMPIVADGKNAQGEPVPTHIDRMVNALQYMNHWQNDWLSISTEYQQASGSVKTALETELDLHRTIANQVGDLVGLLREAGAVEWPRFVHKGYAAFFERFGLHAWHEQYLSMQKPAPPPPPVAPQEPTAAPRTTVDFLMEDHPLAPSTVPDLLVPTPLPQPQPAHQESAEQSEEAPSAPVFAEIDALLDAQHLQQDANATPEPPLEDLPNTLLSEPAPLPENDVNDMIRDAWFWVNQGREEHGMELFELAREQYPDHLELKEQYRAAQA